MSSYLAFKSLIASYSKKSEFIALHLALSQMGRVEEREKEAKLHSSCCLPASVSASLPVSGSVCGSAMVLVTLRNSALGIDTE